MNFDIDEFKHNQEIRIKYLFYDEYKEEDISFQTIDDDLISKIMN